MKIFIIAIIALSIFSGCASTAQTNKLLKRNAIQAMQIQQQQELIGALKAKLTQRHTARKHLKKKRKRVERKKVSTLPPEPKKNIKLKKVEDNNYSSGYMYPEDTKAAKKDSTEKKIKTSVSSSMSREECIAMISQEKFDKYTSIFGSEAASIKRCVMLKAMHR